MSSGKYDREGFMKIMLALKSNYRNFPARDPESQEVWFQMLKDIPIKDLRNAVIKLISESEFPPTIADIRKHTVESRGDAIISPSDAWGEVEKAIRNFGSYREQEALEELSPLTRRIVKSLGFKNLCYSENQMADRAHFIKLYSGMMETEKKKMQLPDNLRKEIQGREEKNKEKLKENVQNLLEGKDL